MEIKNSKSSMEVSLSFHNKSEHPDSDRDNNGVAAHSPAFAGDGDGRIPALSDAALLPTIRDWRIPALADSVASGHCLGSAPPVVNLVDTLVFLAAVQPRISLTHYNLRPRVSRLP